MKAIALGVLSLGFVTWGSVNLARATENNLNAEDTIESTANATPLKKHKKHCKKVRKAFHLGVCVGKNLEKEGISVEDETFSPERRSKSFKEAVEKCRHELKRHDEEAGVSAEEDSEDLT